VRVECWMWKVVLAVEAAGLPVWTSLELAFVVAVLNRSLQGFDGRPFRFDISLVLPLCPSFCLLPKLPLGFKVFCFLHSN
jgi:hypothetical protein